MSIKRNVGTLDSYIHIAAGVTMVACGASRAARAPGLFSDFLILFGASKIAEGITKYDPLWSVLGVSTLDRETGKSDIRKRAAEIFSDPVTQVYPHLNDRRAEIPPQPTIT